LEAATAVAVVMAVVVGMQSFFFVDVEQKPGKLRDANLSFAL
jgi:hypothetical protein